MRHSYRTETLGTLGFGDSPHLLVEKSSLIKALGFAHGALDVQGTDVLPVFLQQRHQEVDCQVDVVNELVLRHLHVSDSYSQTEHLRNNHTVTITNDLNPDIKTETHLLHLELDGGFNLIDLRVQVLVVSEEGGELAGLVQPRAQDTRDLLDERL